MEEPSILGFRVGKTPIDSGTFLESEKIPSDVLQADKASFSYFDSALEVILQPTALLPFCPGMVGGLLALTN